MDTLAIFDGHLTTATQTFFLILGIWGLVRAITGKGVDGSYYGALAVGVLMYAVQLGLDLLLFFGGIKPHDRAWLHYLYALFAVLLIPYLYTSSAKDDSSNKAQWIYAFATFFLWGIAVRAITTG